MSRGARSRSPGLQPQSERRRWGLAFCCRTRQRSTGQPHRNSVTACGTPEEASAAAQTPHQVEARTEVDTPSNAQRSTKVAEEEEERLCRYCFEGEDAGELISPCRCAGGQKYVHLSCLRWWQRAVLISQPTHPDLYDTDTRQRICNVCKAEFSCPPPTRAELLASFTGPELAALISEGCIIASSEGFSRELEQEVAVYPPAVRENIVCHNWVRGAFLITTVVEDRGERSSVLLRLGDSQDLTTFLEHLGENGYTFHLRGREFKLLSQGPLRHLPEDLTAAARRRAIGAIKTPALMVLRPRPQADCGEDGVLAVNITRSFKPMGKRLHKFGAAVRRVLGQQGELGAEVTHYRGGPCEEEDVAACFVLVDGRYRIVKDGDCLMVGLRVAHALSNSSKQKDSLPVFGPAPAPSDQVGASSSNQLAKNLPGGLRSRLWRGARKAAPSRRAAAEAAGNAGDDAEEEEESRQQLRHCQGVHWISASPGPEGGHQPLVTEQQPPGHMAEEPQTPPVKLFVFWGYAGWSRCQLMGEIARGSWGLCKSMPEDVLSTVPGQAYECVYPRLVFAPRNDMSETYGGEVPEEEARRRELRRMVIFHDLLLRQTGRARRGEPEAGEGLAAMAEAEQEFADLGGVEHEDDSTSSTSSST